VNDIVIIGAGTAGMTAAIYAARAGKSVMLLEGEALGGQIASSPRVENYPGLASVSGMDFSDALFQQVQNLGVQFTFGAATGIRAGSPMTVLTADGELPCKSIILATGSHHRGLGLARERELTGHGVSYCAICDGSFYKAQDVGVVGGGSAALQSAEYLCGVCHKVYLIHRRDTFRGEEKLVERLKKNANLEMILDSTVQSLQGEQKLSGITVRSKKTDVEREIALSGLFIAAGQEPSSAPFSGVVKTDDGGYYLAAEDCVTNVPGIFAAGDCRRKAVRQLTTAAADGSVAALAACTWVDGH
jgi:thioredoxin reductase (NADPH)